MDIASRYVLTMNKLSFKDNEHILELFETIAKNNKNLLQLHNAS
jgi:hypothetical protein